MASSEAGELSLPIDDLLNLLTKSFLSTASQLKRVMKDTNWQESPYIYHMPGMTLDIKLGLSYSETKVKGIFRKKRHESEQDVNCSLRLEIIAVPNSTIPKGDD